VYFLAIKSPPRFGLLPASSWQSVESESGPPQATTIQTSALQPSSVLVEPDFRGKFIENQKRIASSTNLAAAGRLGKSGSMVRFADDKPERDKERQALLVGEGDCRKSQSEQPARIIGPRGTSTDSQVFEDDNNDKDNERKELPRTKSQLSLLIESQRKQNGRPAARQQEPKAKERAASLESREDEDELIMMGRREGVTRAGGVAPGRSTHRISGASAHRYRSPTPPPLYG